MTPEEFFAALHQIPEPRPLIYRLYHDQQGMPLFYSMEDLPGNYIDIDQATFNRTAMNVRVKHGKLIELTWQTTQKLNPSTSGTQCHPQDVSVIVASDGVCWSKQTYEQN